MYIVQTQMATDKIHLFGYNPISSLLISFLVATSSNTYHFMAPHSLWRRPTFYMVITN